MDVVNYINLLNNNTSTTLQLAKTCSAEQLLYTKNSCWNILQILEHIYVTDKVVITLLLHPSDKRADTPEIIGNDTLKKYIVELRNRKVQAPESIQPKGEIKDVATFEHLFLEQRNLLKHYLESGKIVINTTTHKHPFLGEMTITDWLNFIIHHTQRHLEQIKDNLTAFKPETN